ncbi:hypothetical protein IAR50_003515 [Cryptococcus sp. DSM 104548]
MQGVHYPYQFSRPRDPDDTRLTSLKPITHKRFQNLRRRGLEEFSERLRVKIPFQQAVRFLNASTKTKSGHKGRKRRLSKDQVLTELHKTPSTPKQNTNPASLSPNKPHKSLVPTPLDEQARNIFRRKSGPIPRDDDDLCPRASIPRHRLLKRRITQEAEDGSFKELEETAPEVNVVLGAKEEDDGEGSSDDEVDEADKEEDLFDEEDFQSWKRRLSPTDDEQVLYPGEARVVWQQGTKLSIRVGEKDEAKSTGEVDEAYRLLFSFGALPYHQSCLRAFDLAPTDHYHALPETLHDAFSVSPPSSPPNQDNEEEEEDQEQVSPREAAHEMWARNTLEGFDGDEDRDGSYEGSWIKKIARARAPLPEEGYGEESEGLLGAFGGASSSDETGVVLRRSLRSSKVTSYRFDDDDDDVSIDPELLGKYPLDNCATPPAELCTRIPLPWDMEEWEMPEEEEDVEETVTPPSPSSPTPSLSPFPQTPETPIRASTQNPPTTSQLPVSPLRVGFDSISLQDGSSFDDPPYPYPYPPNPALHFWEALYDVASSEIKQPRRQAISAIEDLQVHPSNARRAVVIPQFNPTPSPFPQPTSLSPNDLPPLYPAAYTTNTTSHSRLLTPGIKKGLARKTSDIFEEDNCEKPGMKRGRKRV